MPNQKLQKPQKPVSISIIDFRLRAPYVLDDIRTNAATYLITRFGKPVAVVGPVDEQTMKDAREGRSWDKAKGSAR